MLNIKKEGLEINVAVKEEKELKFLGTYRKKINGGKFYRYCKKENKMFQAEYKKEETYKIGQPNQHKLVVKKDSIYIEALNIKNDIKRLRKGKIIFAS